MTMNRRQFTRGFLSTGATASLAFTGLMKSTAALAAANQSIQSPPAYGPLIADPNGVLDLPKGFTYHVISRAGDKMSDGLITPSAFDGMGCFDLGDGKIALVRNHELSERNIKHSAFGGANTADINCYDRMTDGGAILPGGTSTLVYDTKTKTVTNSYLSLAGTIRNCAGGITSWGSWLTCEETMIKAGDKVTKDHGWVFEVPAKHTGLVDPKPLKAMGRFNHEAAAVDPETGTVYMTEDRNESLFYRFIPTVKGDLAQGGKLQALALDTSEPQEKADTRNWSKTTFTPQSWAKTRWIDLEDIESPKDDLRFQGAKKGAMIFARGEGLHYGVNGDTGKGEFYFCCTSGGAAKLGQIMRYIPGDQGNNQGGKIQNFVESTSKDMMNFGDNLTVAPNGHLMVCEDQYDRVVTNHIRGVTPKGATYPFAFTKLQTEFAGACFSPDGSTLFVNLYHPGQTLAITGPWDKFKA